MFFNRKSRIQAMTEALRSMSSGLPAPRINVSPYDDLGKLAETFNSCLGLFEGRIASLEKEYRQLQAILNNMSEGVILVDLDLKVISLNPATEKLFGVMERESLGKYFLEVFRNNDLADILHASLTKGSFVSEELTLVWPVQKIFQVNVSPILQSAKVTGCLAVIHDVTPMRKLETVRRDFVANVSHELKTPLTSIKGFVETLLEGALNDKEHSRHFLEIIQNHTDRLTVLINDLLDLSSIESKEIVLEKALFGLKSLLDEVVLGFESQIKKKQIKIEFSFHEKLLVTADRNRLAQVLTNLIDNAIKFNKMNGSIRIAAEDSAGCVKVVVDDSGVGSPERDIPRIFERFYRVDKARSRELGGTGLGLSIVKHIVELHGGTVGVESTEGLGSKFWFSLPV